MDKSENPEDHPLEVGVSAQPIFPLTFGPLPVLAPIVKTPMDVMNSDTPLEITKMQPKVNLKRKIKLEGKSHSDDNPTTKELKLSEIKKSGKSTKSTKKRGILIGIKRKRNRFEDPINEITLGYDKKGKVKYKRVVTESDQVL